MAVKLLIVGESNTGKTTLTKDLKDALVICHDGKNYPFDIPHRNIGEFDSVDIIIDSILDTVDAYKTKFGTTPKTIVIDSVSKIFETINDYCAIKYKNYDVWNHYDKDVKEFVSFIQNTIVGYGVNVVIISHSLPNIETGKQHLVCSGKYAKKNGFLSEVDESIFIDAKTISNRQLHFRNPKLASRTVVADLPDTMSTDEFNLQSHIELLQKSIDKANQNSL